MRWIALLAVLAASPCFAQGNVSLTCTPPTKNTDGTNITGTISYKFYRGTSASNLGTVSQGQSTCAYTWVELPVGTHYFAATATVGGAESPLSNVATKTVGARVPNPPTSLTVQADTAAFVIVKSRDRVALVPVGNVAPGTVCDTSQQVLGKFVVPRSAVTFIGGASDEVIFAACG